MAWNNLIFFWLGEACKATWEPGIKFNGEDKEFILNVEIINTLSCNSCFLTKKRRFSEHSPPSSVCNVDRFDKQKFFHIKIDIEYNVWERIKYWVFWIIMTVTIFVFIYFFSDFSAFLAISQFYDTIIYIFKFCLISRDQIFSRMPRVGFEPGSPWLVFIFYL